jgi:hypothetical protein
VRVEYSSPVSVLRTVTAALGMRRPAGSLTVPAMEPPVEAWAKDPKKKAARKRAKARVRKEKRARSERSGRDGKEWGKGGFWWGGADIGRN